MRTFRFIALGLTIGAVTVLVACSDGPVAVDAPSTQSGSAAVKSQGRDPVDVLGHALAVALADRNLRLRVLEDMRDSPFPRHSLHVASYLRGSRGAPLLAAIVSATGRDLAQFRSELAALPNLALFLNPSSYRATWRGQANVAVLPIYAGALDESGFARGYMTGGSEITVEYFAEAGLPVLVVGTTTIDYGADPEATRAASPRRAGSTISTADELYRLNGRPVDELGANQVPARHDGVAGHHVSGTETCYPVSSGDADNDTMLDSCEYALAYAAAPFLIHDFYDGDWSREPYWAVELLTPELVRVFYALSYHRDYGYDPTNRHYGDSEFIIVDLWSYGSGHWKVQASFLSAHYNSPAESSEWVGLAYPDHPEIVTDPNRPLGRETWVAKHKHANYKSQEACLNGNSVPFVHDVCGNDVATAYTEVFPDANLQLLNCVSSRPNSPFFPWDYVGQECFWTDARFQGWYHHSVASGDDSGPYGPLLTHFGFSPPPPPPPPPLTATIPPPHNVPPWGFCQWTAGVTGGISPYSYQWWKDGVLVGTSSNYFFEVDSGNFFLELKVTDASQAIDWDQRNVVVQSGSNGCPV
jgi:hypothetical protein